jgi:glycolate oxidase FAD binding subunit
MKERARMLTPQSEVELSEAVAAARARCAILGGGTRPVGRPVAGEALSVAGLAVSSSTSRAR